MQRTQSGFTYRINFKYIFLVWLATLFTWNVAWCEENSWYPSQYGAKDTLGAVNRLGPAVVLDAIKLVKKGRVHSLAIDTGAGSPGRGPKKDFTVEVVPKTEPGKAAGSNHITGFDSKIDGWVSIGTNIDGLAHAGIDFLHYNGIPADEIFAPDGIKKLSIHAIPPIVTRGVLLDMAGYYGVDTVGESIAFNRAEISGAAARQGIIIRAGDVVLIHTGRLLLLSAEPERFMSRWPGLGKEGARYLAELGVVAAGADTWAPEINPAENPEERAPVHQILLAQHGIYILELINTAGLAADHVYEFLFVLGIPRIVGSVDALIHPIAID